MTCAEVVELVTAYLEGTLDPETERRLTEHLSGCDGCDTYVDQIRRTITEVGTATPETLPPSTRNALLAAFRTYPRP
jgi:anti-sigma factor RsiW